MSTAQGAVVFAHVPPETNNGSDWCPALVINTDGGSPAVCDLAIFRTAANPGAPRQWGGEIATAVTVYANRTAAPANPYTLAASEV